MKRLVRWLIPAVALALSACCVAPVRGHYYARPGVIVAPAVGVRAVVW